MTRWNSIDECRDNLHLIRLALSDYYNKRTGPVYGLNHAGDWLKIGKAMLVKGNPEGWSIDYGSWFVLRAAEVRDK